MEECGKYFCVMVIKYGDLNQQPSLEGVRLKG